MGNIQKLAVLIGFSLLFNQFVQAASSDIFYENATDAPIFPLLQSARSSIDIEIYEIQDTRVQNIILTAMDRGVKVRVIQESEAVGSNCTIFDKASADDAPECAIQKQFVQKVQAKGGYYVPYAYQQFCSGNGQYRCLEHGKIILVDHQRALISTGNFNPTNLCDAQGVADGTPLTTCNRDYSVVSADPNVVATLTNVFNADFKSKAYDLASILRSSSSRVTVSPFSLTPILQLINSARKSIIIENQYLKDPNMNAALIAAARRGVNVYLIVSSACAFGKPDPQQDASAIAHWKTTYTSFDQAGIKTRIFTKQISVNGLNGYLHAKAILVDGGLAWVGSVNGSTQALTENREFGIFLNDPAQTAKLAKIIISDFNNPNSESWQESLVCKKDY